MPIFTTVGLAIAAIFLSTLQGGQAPAPAGPTIDDPEPYAVYAAVEPLTSLLVDKPVTNVAILQETIPGDVGFDGPIFREWRAVAVAYWTTTPAPGSSSKVSILGFPTLSCP